MIASPVPPLQLRVCAWCEAHIGVEAGAPEAVATHGLCEDCTGELMRSLVAPSEGERSRVPRARTIRLQIRRGA